LAPLDSPSLREILDPSWVHAEPSQETFISKVVCHHFWSKLMARPQTMGHSQPSYSLEVFFFFSFLSFWLAHHPKKLNLARLLKIVISMWAWSASALVHLDRWEGEKFEQSMSLKGKIMVYN
jgi:hypothetical protein